MLVVCALALIVAAGAFLVTGLASGDVGDLTVSMALCVASLVVVAVSARLSRPRPASTEATAPEPVAPDGAEPGPAPLVVVEDDPTVPAEEAPASIWSAPPEEIEAPAPAPVAAPVEVPFPIADYDDLEAEQVVALVPELWPEELSVVAARERRTRARPVVLDALAATAGDPRLAFPIAEYDSLDTAQVTGLLDRLDAVDLVTVQTAERAGQARVGVLVALADALAARREPIGARRP